MHFKKTTAKYLLAGVLSFGLMTATTTIAVAQSAPQAPPTPPPPDEVLHKAGEGLKKINPFKKHKDSKSSPGINPPAGGPPPPPNPLDLFKKKKKGSSSALPPAPPKPPGA